MSDDSRQSCQFYYFNWNKSNDELHQILDKIVNGKNDLIKIKYSGKPELLKGTISLTKNLITYDYNTVIIIFLISFFLHAIIIPYYYN